MFKDLYYDSDPFKGDNHVHDRYLGTRFYVKGLMGSSDDTDLAMAISRY